MKFFQKQNQTYTFVVGSLKQPLIAPASTLDEYIEEEPTVIGHSVSTSRRNDKSMNLSKLDELNQVRI